MRKTAFLIILAALVPAVACQRAPPSAAAAPQPTAAEIAQRRAQDSLAAARRATADSAERARQVEVASRARADSVERARLAATAARTAAEAARQNTALRDDLAVMVHFDVAEAEIQPEGRAILDRKAAILNANPTVRLRITGACDERGSDEYNQALGERRAAAVARYLVAKGVDGARLEQVSAGETSPIDADTGELAWARNRRAEFLVVSGDSPLVMR